MSTHRDPIRSSRTLARPCLLLLIATCLIGINLASITTTAMQAKAQRLRTLREVIPEPPLPRLPRAGGKFIDPAFGTEIMRATDERDDPVGLSTYYSHWPTINRDNTYILVKKGLSG